MLHSGCYWSCSSPALMYFSGVRLPLIQPQNVSLCSDSWTTTSSDQQSEIGSSLCNNNNRITIFTIIEINKGRKGFYIMPGHAAISQCFLKPTIFQFEVFHSGMKVQRKTKLKECLLVLGIHRMGMYFEIHRKRKGCQNVHNCHSSPFQHHHTLLQVLPSMRYNCYQLLYRHPSLMGWVRDQSTFEMQKPLKS